MKLLAFLFVIICVGYGSAAPHLDAANSRDAEVCDPNQCKLPDCLCSSTKIPNGLEKDKIPQLVLLTFDDAVQTINIDYYRKALYDRKNPDGCPAQATYFVSHEYTDYSLVNELYSKGHEIALHSISHLPQTEYWRDASKETIIDEFIGERDLVSHFAQIPKDKISGIRMPFLQLSGNTTYEVLPENGLPWDCSWPTQKFSSPGLWPYTLQYKSDQDCPIGPCPTESLPKSWVAPMIDWIDDKGVVCSMVDACVNIPSDVDGIVEFMKRNFLRHYEKNRAPFGFFVHAAWFVKNPINFDAYLKFLDYLQTLPDVYLVSVSRMLDWVKNPSELDNLAKAWPECPASSLPLCDKTSCRTLKGEEERYITFCDDVECPKTYPWLKNPLGE